MLWRICSKKKKVNVAYSTYIMFSSESHAQSFHIVSLIYALIGFLQTLILKLTEKL